jgi:hypothetical protein
LDLEVLYFALLPLTQIIGNRPWVTAFKQWENFPHLHETGRIEDSLKIVLFHPRKRFEYMGPRLLKLACGTITPTGESLERVTAEF